MKRRLVVRITVASVLMLLGLSGTAALGLWQYSVAHRDEVAREVLTAPEIDLNEVSAVGSYVPEAAYGQRVFFSGLLECSASFTVKPLEVAALWRVCPLTLIDGSKVAVVVVDSQKSFGDAPSVWISGRLQPAQDSSPLPATHQPASTNNAINTDDLVLRWKDDVRDGYVVVEMVVTAGGEVTKYSDIPASQIVTPPVGIELRNLLYAWQWWVFGGFAVLFFGRFVRDELRVYAGVA